MSREYTNIRLEMIEDGSLDRDNVMRANEFLMEEENEDEEE